jgi:hypothetical protein
MQNESRPATQWVNLKNGVRLRLAQYRTGWGCDTWELEGANGGGSSLTPTEPSSRERKHRFATPDHAARFFSIFFDALQPR